MLKRLGNYNQSHKMASLMWKIENHVLLQPFRSPGVSDQNDMK